MQISGCISAPLKDCGKLILHVVPDMGYETLFIRKLTTDSNIFLSIEWQVHFGTFWQSGYTIYFNVLNRREQRQRATFKI